ncbi:MAG: hypothetical protein AAGF57_18120 [Pseudomonadota bacterium]
MDLSLIVMWIGFTLAAYSVVANDVIQTLGTFLTSNEKRLQWWVLWLFAAAILSAALVYGYMHSDISYGRLDRYRTSLTTLDYKWYYALPPLVLLVITRLGVPVSTTFMILTLFTLTDAPQDVGITLAGIFDTNSLLGGMIFKSFSGCVLAFVLAGFIYIVFTELTEKRFIEKPVSESSQPYWITAQWLATGFLWFQWLTQDLANIYVFLRGGYDLSIIEFSITLFIFLSLLAFTFYTRGGAVQEVVRSKTNTADIRAATFIDLLYGIILYIFKYDSFLGFDYKLPWTGNLPMSTTWVFVGLLAGRELGMRLMLDGRFNRSTVSNVAMDFAKVMFGLVVSIVLVIIIKLLGT